MSGITGGTSSCSVVVSVEVPERSRSVDKDPAPGRPSPESEVSLVVGVMCAMVSSTEAVNLHVWADVDAPGKRYPAGGGERSLLW